LSKWPHQSVGLLEHGMTSEHFTQVLAKRVLGWSVAPDRFMIGGRRWLPSWGFQPATRLEDALRVLKGVALEEFVMGGAESGGLWANVRVADTREASDLYKPRVITVAIARRLGIKVGSSG
jgi:hypothetical protein